MDKKNISAAATCKLAKLRASYRKRLANELMQLEVLAKRLESSPSDYASLTTIQRLLDRLAGSAGTFGFVQLGDKARLLEKKALQWMDDSAFQANLNLLTKFVEEIQSLYNMMLADNTSEVGIANDPVGRKDKSENRVIWLLERDLMLANYMVHQLHNFGFIVLVFSDVAQLEGADVTLPDLLLIDHQAAQAAEDLENPMAYWQERLVGFSCPVLFTGGKESFQARLNAVQAGAIGYFVKPLNIPKLADHMAELLQEREVLAERILIVEEDIKRANYYADVLRKAGMEVSVLDKPEELLQHTSRFRPELVLMEWHLSNLSGGELAAVMRQFRKWNNLIILFIAGTLSQKKRMKALMMGGDDILIRPIQDDLLVNVCRNRVRRVRDFKKASVWDGLTGLVKHSGIKEALAVEFAAAKRHGSPLTLAMLDIDLLKTINDTHGHAVGDVVISTVGTLLRQHFRGSDWLGRYGGEKFLVLLLDCDPNAAIQILNNFREAFSAVAFLGSDRSFSCTISAGIACNQTFPRLSAEQLLERTESALSRAKEQGRNQVCLAEKN